MGLSSNITRAFNGALGRPLGFGGLSGGSGVAVGSGTTPFIATYPWINGIGFGTKFANPATLPSGFVNGVVFNKVSNTIFLALNASPFISAYPWSANGFGTKYANPGTLPNGAGMSIAYRIFPQGTQDVVAMGDNNGGAAIFINAYTFSKSGAGWGSKFGNPATLPTGQVNGVDFSPDGLNIALAHNTSPFLSVYPFGGSGFGLKYANPAVLPPSGSTGTRFSKLGGMVCCVHAFNTGENISAYHFANALGTKYAAPSYPGVPPDHFAQGVAVTKGAVAIGQAITANFDKTISWRWGDTDGFSTRHTPLPEDGEGANALCFNPRGDAIFVTSSTEQLYARRWTDNSGYGTAYNNPATLPVGNTLSIIVAD